MTSEVKLPPSYGWHVPPRMRSDDHGLYMGEPHEPAKYSYGEYIVRLYTAEQVRAVAESHATSIRAQVIEEVARHLDYIGLPTSEKEARALNKE